MYRLTRALVVVSLSVLGAESRADVLTVGPGGFATPQAAINAASDGDVILIEAGVHPGFVIDNKELFVAASQLVFPVRVGASSVQNLAAGKTVVLADLRIVSETTGRALGLTACAGAVRVQGCDVRVDAVSSSDALFASASPSIVVTDSMLRGGSHTSAVYGGGAGARLHNSGVAFHRSSSFGGSSGIATTWIWWGATERGGDGLAADGSFLYSNNTSFSGGNGGGLSLPWSLCQNSSNIQELGRGGHGATLMGLNPSQTWFTRPQLTRGDNGPSNCSYTMDEWPPAKDFVRGPAGSIAGRLGGGLGRHMALSARAVGPNSAAASFVGAPDELVHVVLSLAPDFAWNSVQVGVVGIALGSALPPQTVGQLDANGLLAASVALPPLPAGTPNRTWHVQSFFTDGSGAMRLGPSSCVAQLP